MTPRRTTCLRCSVDIVAARAFSSVSRNTWRAFVTVGDRIVTAVLAAAPCCRPQYPPARSPTPTPSRNRQRPCASSTARRRPRGHLLSPSTLRWRVQGRHRCRGSRRCCSRCPTARSRAASGQMRERASDPGDRAVAAGGGQAIVRLAARLRQLLTVFDDAGNAMPGLLDRAGEFHRTSFPHPRSHSSRDISARISCMHGAGHRLARFPACASSCATTTASTARVLRRWPKWRRSTARSGSSRPTSEQSSMGHAITAGRPLSYRRTPIAGRDAYRVNGTPGGLRGAGRASVGQGRRGAVGLQPGIQPRQRDLAFGHARRGQAGGAARPSRYCLQRARRARALRRVETVDASRAGCPAAAEGTEAGQRQPAARAARA